MAFEHLGRTGVLWLMNKVKLALATKVDKVEGKGLSTNDLTAALKSTYDTAVSDVAALKKQGGGAEQDCQYQCERYGCNPGFC